MVEVVRIKSTLPLLGLGLVLLLSACSDKPSDDASPVESVEQVEQETISSEDSVDTNAEASEAAIELPLPESIPELGALPRNDYEIAFGYLSSVENYLDGLGWNEFVVAADYLLIERDALVASEQMGDLVLTGRISDVLTNELANRTINGGVTTDEVRGVLNRYRERPYDIDKLSRILELEHGQKVKKFRGSEMERYRELNRYATNLSGSEDELFSGAGDDAAIETWFIEGKRSIISLANVYMSYHNALALDALLNYIDRGGDTTLDWKSFNESIRELVPESFEQETLPELREIDLPHLHPADVHRLISKS